MSQAQRPAAKRTVTTNPALSEANTSIPVTPGIEGDEYKDPNPYDRAFNNAPTNFDKGSSGTAGPAWNANITSPPDAGPEGRKPESPDVDEHGNQTGEALLRRFSESGKGSEHPDLADVDPRAAHPNLHLSGHVISVSFCVPYKLAWTPGADWVG